MTTSNQVILTDFFEAIIRIVSEGTSDTYATLVILEFTKRNTKTFPFLKHIHYHSNKIRVDEKVNSANTRLIVKFINKLINSLFSELFKHLLKRKMGHKVSDELQDIGIKI